MKKLLKILLKIGLGILLVLGIGFGILYAVYNKPMPTGKEGAAADALAEKMVNAINYEAYKNTRYLEWTFAGGAHHYIWDKTEGKVQVTWKAYSVDLNLNNPEKSKVKEGRVAILGTSRTEVIQKATAYFNNDSFWVVAPFKVFDKGCKRSIVTMKDGSEALLVEYLTGGTTPGDAYLWKLLPNGFPENFQMWVKIIPIGGIEATWDDWKIMENGIVLAASHKIGPITLSLGDVKAYD